MQQQAEWALAKIGGGRNRDRRQLQNRAAAVAAHSREAAEQSKEATEPRSGSTEKGQRQQLHRAAAAQSSDSGSTK